MSGSIAMGDLAAQPVFHGRDPCRTRVCRVPPDNQDNEDAGRAGEMAGDDNETDEAGTASAAGHAADDSGGTSPTSVNT